MRHRFQIQILVAVIATLSSYGCREAPTAPEATIEPAPPPLALSPESAAAVAATIDDARLRVVPGLGDAPAVERLRHALDALSAALDTRDRRALDRALGGTQAALDALAGGDTEATAVLAPDLEAVRLMLTVAGPLLDPGTDSKVR